MQCSRSASSIQTFGRRFRPRDLAVWRARFRGSHIGWNLRQRDREAECAAHKFFAVQRNLPAHLLHQAAAHGETQAGASKFARRRTIYLAERFKNDGPLLRRDALSGIANAEMNAVGFARKSVPEYEHLNAALFSEFYGVVHQV